MLRKWLGNRWLHGLANAGMAAAIGFAVGWLLNQTQMTRLSKLGVGIPLVVSVWLYGLSRMLEGRWSRADRRTPPL